MEMFESTGEAVRVDKFKGLSGKVGITLCGKAVLRLEAVQQKRGAKPERTELGDGKDMFVMERRRGGEMDTVSVDGFGDADETEAGIGEQLLESEGVGNLHDDGRSFGKEDAERIRFVSETVYPEAKAAFGIGKTHLKQGGDKSAGRNVVSGEEKALTAGFLNGGKGSGKIAGLNRGGRIA